MSSHRFRGSFCRFRIPVSLAIRSRQTSSGKLFISTNEQSPPPRSVRLYSFRREIRMPFWAVRHGASPWHLVDLGRSRLTLLGTVKGIIPSLTCRNQRFCECVLRNDFRPLLGMELHIAGRIVSC